MRLAEVQRRVREFHVSWRTSESDGGPSMGTLWDIRSGIYYDTLRTLLDHDLPDDARQLIEAALEAER